MKRWGTAVGGFALGLLLAALLVAVWLTGSRLRTDSTAVSAPARTSSADGGLIGSTDRAVMDRLRAERKTITRVQNALTFRALNVTWQDAAGPDFVHAPELSGRLDARALEKRDILVRGLVIVGGDVLLEQSANGNWNYRRVLAPILEGEDEGGRERVFHVTDIALRQATVRVRSPARSFDIVDLAAQLPSAAFSAPNLAAPHVAIARATGRLVVRDSSYALVVENGSATFPSGRVDFDAQHVTMEQSRMANVRGTFGGELPGSALRVAGVVESMRFENVRFVSARLPSSGSASFTFEFRPVDERVNEMRFSNATAESGGSKVTGSATVLMRDSLLSIEAVNARLQPLTLALVEDMLGDTLPYQGTISGTARGSGGLISFDVNTRLTSRNSNEPIISHMIGSGRFAANTFDLRRLDADVRAAPVATLRAVMPQLPLRGTISGRLLLTGPPERAPLDVDIRVELANGLALINGRIDLTGSAPTYDVSGRLIAIDLQQLFEFDVPPVFLTARFTAAGTGVKPDSARAHVRVDGVFGGWRASSTDSLHLDARLENGTAHVDRGAIKLASMTGSASGRWRFVAPASGSLDYRMAFEPITPFGPYFPAVGDDDASGNVHVSGTISGERARIHINGDAAAGNLILGGWSAAELAGKYALVLGPQIPEITFEGSGRAIQTPTAGIYESLTAKLRLVSPAFNLEVHADRADGGGGVEILADGRIPPTGAREVVLQRARLDLGARSWALNAPAVFTWIAPATDLHVRGFELRQRDGNGVVRLDGRVLPLASADFTIETTALPIGDLQQLLGRTPVVSGALTTRTTLQAIDGVPQLTMRFQLDTAIIEDVRFAQLFGDASYNGQTLTAHATAVVDTAGRLQLSAELPMDLRLGPERRVRLAESGPVHVTLVSDSLALAPFAALHPDVQHLTGSLAANVNVTGTIAEPVLAGSISVKNATVRLLPLNQRYDSINAIIELDNRSAIIRDLVARSGGVMRATGTVEFRELDKPFIDLTARFARFAAVGVDNQTDAATTGELRLTGPVSGAVLRGRIRVADGFMPIPQTGARTFDTEFAQFEADLPAEPAGTPRTSFYRSLTIDDLRITAGENLWFAMEDARAELSGELVIDKSGDVLNVVGELNGERGTYTLRAGPIIRRFDVTAARIRFLGGRDINPALDISARRRVVDLNGQQFDIAVNIRGTMQRPTLALASEEQQNVPQSELLSFLLFGRPSVAIGGTTLTAQKEIGETYIGGIAELLSMELEQAFIDQLGMGLDIFQIRLGGGRLSNLDRAAVVVGEEIRNNLFLTVEYGVQSLFGTPTGSTATTASAAATFAVRLEWSFSRNANARASYEPVNQSLLLRNYARTQLDEHAYQIGLELRRRWTW